MIILAMFAGLFVLMLVFRVPIGFALLLPSLTYLFATDTSIGLAFQQMVFGIDKFVLLAIPMFILMGNLANQTGITEKLFEGARAVVGNLRGSYGYINILVSLGFSWMNGAALADVGASTKTMVPQMTKAGYPEKYSLGITAASSMIGPIMPPSIPAVIYAMTAGVSMGGMLIAGVVPALLIVFVLMVTVWWMSRRWDHLRNPINSRKEKGKALLHAVPAMFTPVILLGGILGGFFTPTEASGFAVVYMIILGIIYRRLSFRELRRCILDSATSTASIMFIIASATLFGWVLTREGAARILTSFVLENINEPIIFLLLLNVVLLILGMVMETGAVILIIVPVLMPIASTMGIDPYQLGIIVIFNLMIGLITPPVGLVLYVMESVGKHKFGTIVAGVLRFIPSLLICLLIITHVPAISAWLPGVMGF